MAGGASSAGICSSPSWLTIPTPGHHRGESLKTPCRERWMEPAEELILLLRGKSLPTAKNRGWEEESGVFLRKQAS